MAESEHPEVHHEEDDQRDLVGGRDRLVVEAHARILDLSSGQCHFQDVEKADHNILRPVEDHDRRQAPVPEKYSEQRDQVGSDESKHGQGRHVLDDIAICPSFQCLASATGIRKEGMILRSGWGAGNEILLHITVD